MFPERRARHVRGGEQKDAAGILGDVHCEARDLSTLGGRKGSYVIMKPEEITWPESSS